MFLKNADILNRNRRATWICITCLIFILIIQGFVHSVSAADQPMQDLTQERIVTKWYYPLASNEYATYAEISENTEYIVISSHYDKATNGNLYLFNRDGNLLWKIPLSVQTSDVAVSKNCEYIVIGSSALEGTADYNVYVYNRNGELLWKYLTNEIVFHVAISRDGQTIVAASRDGYDYIFDNNGNLLWKYPGMWGPVAISDDGKIIAAVSENGEICIFNREGSILHSYPIDGRIGSVLWLEMSWDGQFITAATLKNENIYFFAKNGWLIRKYPLDSAPCPRTFTMVDSRGSTQVCSYWYSIDYSPDGKYVVVGSADNYLSLFTNSGGFLWKKEISDSVHQAQVTKNGEYIAATNTEGNFYLYDIDGNLLKTYEGNNFNAFSLSEDGKYIVSGMGPSIIFGENLDAETNATSTTPNPRPVLIVHGLGDTASSVENTKLYNELSKGRKVYAIEYLGGPANAYGDIREYAKMLDEKIKEIKAETNSDKVDIVAHSMGGLISRYRIQKIENGDSDVGKLIMIGTPNHGCDFSRDSFWVLKTYILDFGYAITHLFNSEYEKDNPDQAINQMHPRSDFLFQLNGNRATESDVEKGQISDTISSKVNYSVIAGNEIDTMSFDVKEVHVKGDFIVPYNSAKLSDAAIYPVPGNHWDQLKNDEIILIVQQLLDQSDISPSETDNDPENNQIPILLSAPQLIFPVDGQVFSNYPRWIQFKWTSVPGAETYNLEIQSYYLEWQPERILKGISGPEYDTGFVGAQPGRWRVWAVSADGEEGPKSNWQKFEYTV